jgi:hypothetical protein
MLISLTGISGAYPDDFQVKEPVYADTEKVWFISEKLVGVHFDI